MTSKQTHRIPGEWRISYSYTIGDYAAQFFEGLKAKKILGSVCGQSGEVSVPPKAFDEASFTRVEGDLLEVGLEGTIEAATVVTAPFEGSPPVPYAVAYVRLEGASTAIANYVRGVDLADGQVLPAQLAIGARVRVAFADEPQGRITDFWFEPEED